MLSSGRLVIVANVLEIAELAYANITKKNITSQKLGSRDLWQITNSLLNKSKSIIPPLSNNPEGADFCI